jgi:hypothetical protein
MNIVAHNSRETTGREGWGAAPARDAHRPAPGRAGSKKLDCTRCAPQRPNAYTHGRRGLRRRAVLDNRCAGPCGLSSLVENRTKSHEAQPRSPSASAQRSRASGAKITGIRWRILAMSSFGWRVAIAHVAGLFPYRHTSWTKCSRSPKGRRDRNRMKNGVLRRPSFSLPS